MNTHLFKILAVLMYAAVTLWQTPAQANVIYEFVCTSPLDCDGDTNFKVEFEFTDAVLSLGGTTIEAANVAFVGWSVASSVGDGFVMSGTTFHNNFNTDIDFSFNSDASAIPGLLDTASAAGVIEMWDGGITGFISIIEGDSFSYFITQRRDITDSDPAHDIVNISDIDGRFVRKLPEPGTLAIFVLGLAGLGFMRRRRRTA